MLNHSTNSSTGDRLLLFSGIAFGDTRILSDSLITLIMLIYLMD